MHAAALGTSSRAHHLSTLTRRCRCQLWSAADCRQRQTDGNTSTRRTELLTAAGGPLKGDLMIPAEKAS